MTLNEYRNEIDALDRQILELLNRRAEASRRIGALKIGAGLPVTDGEREQKILHAMTASAAGDLSAAAAARIYRRILAESRAIQEGLLRERALAVTEQAQ